MPIPSVSILRVETGRKQKNGYPRYPNSFPCVFDPFASLTMAPFVFQPITKFESSILRNLNVR